MSAGSIQPPSNGSLTDTRYLTAHDLVDLHVAVTTEFGGRQTQPGSIASQFGLLNAIQRPQTTVFGREAYPRFADKAAAFVFAILQNNPFAGGNRRLALVALLTFCELNGKAIDPKVLDERALENLIRKASAVQSALPPEGLFKEIREILGAAIR